MIISTCRTQMQNGVLDVEEAPNPTPGQQEIVIDIAAAGVNRADLLQATGHYPPPPGAPTWPGLEVSGTVREVGDQVSRHRPGDHVVALLAGGGYAEQVAVHEDLALPLPDGLDLIAAGGLMEAACTVWSNFDAAGARAGQTVLIHGGAGGVGTLAIQVARAMGMTVIATAGSDERAARCAALGAHTAVNYRSESFVDAARTHGGADIILDVVGAAYLTDNLAALATGGTLVVIGLQKGSRGEINLGTLLSKRARVIGTTLRSRPHKEKAAIVAGVERDLWPLVPTTVAPVIHGTYPLAQAQQAHDDLAAGNVCGKLLLLP